MSERERSLFLIQRNINIILNYLYIMNKLFMYRGYAFHVRCLRIWKYMKAWTVSLDANKLSMKLHCSGMPASRHKFIPSWNFKNKIYLSYFHCIFISVEISSRSIRHTIFIKHRVTQYQRPKHWIYEYLQVKIYTQKDEIITLRQLKTSM